MPVNAPAEYFKAEEEYHKARSKEEKIEALEEMLRQLPNHKGAANLRAQLKSRISKIKKQSEGGKGRSTAIPKEGEAQVCIIGKTNSGKSTLLRKITDAEPKVASYPYTTKKPEVAAMDYNGLKIQVVEIPSTWEQQWLSTARTADLVVLMAEKKKDRKAMLELKERERIKPKHIFISKTGDPNEIKKKIWSALGLIIAYTKDHGKLSPMALPEGSDVEDFARKIHKDFVKYFRFARLKRNGRIHQVGLDYKVKNEDIIEIFTE